MGRAGVWQGLTAGGAWRTRRHVSPSCLLPRSQDRSRMASARPPPDDRISRWQLHARQASSPPPGSQNRLWPLPLVPPQVPACDPGGPASLPSPRPLRRTFLYPSCPLSKRSPTPAWRGPRGQWTAVCGAKVEEAAKIPKSVQVALGCRPGGLGGRPVSPSLSLPPFPLRAQLPGKIIQATPLKRSHGRALRHPADDQQDEASPHGRGPPNGGTRRTP